MATKTLLTLGQFFALPEFDENRDRDYELDHGELICLPPQPYEHELVKNTIADLLRPFLAGRGRVFVEAGFITDPESWRKPDVSVFWNERLANWNRKDPLEGTPELCVEVHSPSESQRTQKRRAAHLLETGARIVWVIYPDTREVQILTPESERWLEESDELTCPELLPELRIFVRAIFD